MDLLYFLKVLLKRKWIIIGISAFAMVLAFVFKMFQKPLYESKAQYSTGFTIDRVKIAEGSPVADLYAADTKFDNVIETFKSPRVIGMISYRLMLHDLENPGVAWKKLSEKEKESKEYKSVKIDTVIKVLSRKVNDNEMLRSDLPEERRILEFLKVYHYDYNSLLENLFIDRVNKTDFLDIVYRSENPYESAWIVNELGNEFLNYYKTLSYQRTNENVLNIKQLEKQQQDKIDSLNGILLAVKVSQGSIDPASLSASAMETVKDLEGKFADEKSKYELNSNRINFLKQSLSLVKSSSGDNQTNNSELLDLINQRNKLETQLIAKGGTDENIQQELKSIRTKINAKSSNSGSTIKNSDRILDLQNQINEATALMKAAEATMSDYTQRINYYKGLTRISPGSGVKMDVIKNQLEIEQKQLGNLKEKLNQAEGLSNDDPSSNFTQTLLGQPAVDPEPKKTMTTMGISGMSMFFFTCFAFLFIEVFNSSIKTPYGFEKTVDMHLLSVINNVKTKNSKAVILDDEKKLKPNEDLFRNSIRKLRHELISSQGRVFLFTSTVSGTGKSFLIDSLAMSLVLIRKKVLLIDFNLHNNTLTQKYNAEATVQGLNNKVNLPLPNSAQQFSSPTEVEDVSIIGCEKSPNSPSEVFFKFKFDEFLDSLKNSFDFILIEASALDKYSDTKELVKFVDKVIPVFSADQSISQGDKIALQYLASLDEKCYGAVLNNVLPENLKY